MEYNTILNAFLKILERNAPLQKKYLKKQQVLQLKS